ncbi:MAG: tail sheath stabilizer and completion protein [Minisyncoccia bacterium]
MKNRAFNWEIHDLIGQFIAAFDDVVIGRFNRNRVEQDRIEVAYLYQPKARVLHDIENRAQNLKLPIGAIVIDSISRNNERVFNKIEGFTYPARREDRFTKQTVKIPPVVPVDIKVKLSLLATYQTDIDQLISNFAAYANPYIIISWQVPEEFGLPVTMPLNTKVEWDGNISITYPLDINHSARSVITADASFLIEGWLFKEIVDPIENIYFIDDNFYNTRILSAGNFITYDDYATLSGADYSYREGEISITNIDTVSISGASTITNVFYSPASSERGSFPLIDTSYTISDPGDIIVYGKRFNSTRNVYLSSNASLYNNITAVDFTYYPSFTATLLPASSYRVITDNIMEITLPTLTGNGQFDIIIDTIVGWDTTYSAMSGGFII